jgi:hypothetical protein
MGRVHPGARILGLVDRAQMMDALLGEQGEKLALEFVVAAGLTGEMDKIDGGLGHQRLENGGSGGSRRRSAQSSESAVMVNEALTTFVNRHGKRVPNAMSVNYPSNW